MMILEGANTNRLHSNKVGLDHVQTSLTTVQEDYYPYTIIPLILQTSTGYRCIFESLFIPCASMLAYDSKWRTKGERLAGFPRAI